MASTPTDIKQHIQETRPAAVVNPALDMDPDARPTKPVVAGVPGASEKRPGVWKIIKSIFLWYEGMSPLEKRTVLKQDLTLLSFCCLNFFLKYLDQTNVKSAFVSGMKEELSLYGNQLVMFDTLFNLGYMLFQVPFLLLLSRPKFARWLFPSVELLWGVLTLCQYKVTNYQQLYAIRFLLGSLEAISYSGANYILGSWYRGDMLFKRAGVFQISNGLGKMFSGYLQSAAYTNLSGVHGMSGWRWLFIIDAIITIPIAFLGFIFFPGLPQSGKPWFMKDDEYELALKRVKESGIAPPKKIKLETVKKVAKRWHIYICVATYVIMLCQTYPVGTMSLWLKKDEEGKHWTVPQINNYPTIVDAVGVVSTWLAGSIAGSVNIFGLFTALQGTALVASISLLVWNIPFGWKFACYIINGIQNAPNPVLFSWINIITRRDAEERAVVLGTTMTFGWAMNAWVPLVAFPQPDAPRYPKGYPVTVTFIIVSTMLFLFGGVLQRREDARLVEEDANAVEDSVSSISDEKEASHHVEQKA